MKQITFFFIALICNFSFAQDPRLFANPWFLTDIITEGVSSNPPGGNYSLTFDSETSMMAHGCNNMMATPTFENNLVNFSATDFSPCLCWCTWPEADAYDDLYFAFFMGADSEMTQNFTYSITELDDVKTLTINSMFNQQAEYSSVQLAVGDHEKTDFTVYPNPSADFVMIDLRDQNSNNAKVDIYDHLGKRCKSQSLSPGQSNVDLRDLPSGIYFIKLNIGSATAVKKLIKL